MASLPVTTPPVFHSEFSRAADFVCSMGSMWFYLSVPCSHELQKHFGEKEQREGSSEEGGGNRLLRCKNSFMVDCVNIWAVSSLEHISPVHGLVPWCFSVPLPKQARTLASALQAGKDHPLLVLHVNQTRGVSATSGTFRA